MCVNRYIEIHPKIRTHLSARFCGCSSEIFIVWAEGVVWPIGKVKSLIDIVV